jgi:hypothetical protein
MKRIIISLILLLAVMPILVSQPWDRVGALKKLGVTEEQIKKIIEIDKEGENQKHQAQVELNLLRAQLEKVLFSVDVDMKEVEKLLRGAMDWRVKIELAEIRKRVETRKIVGETVWQELMRIQEQKRQERVKNNRKDDNPDQPRPGDDRLF